MTDKDFMLKAIDIASEGMAKGQSPFGACIVKDGQIIALEHNRVWADTNITAHAEICAISSACKKIKSVDLSNAVIYSTTEPCPMCFSAIHWARIDKIFYGSSIADAKNAGFNELTVSNEDMKKLGNSNVKIKAGLCREQAIELFEKWLTKPDKRTY